MNKGDVFIFDGEELRPWYAIPEDVLIRVVTWENANKHSYDSRDMGEGPAVKAASTVTPTQNSLVCAEHGLTPDPECMVCHLNPTKTTGIVTDD